MAYISFTNPKAQEIAKRVGSSLSKFENIENNPNAIDMFHNSMDEAVQVVNSTLADLQEIKSLVGPHDANYKELSNEIALILLAFMNFVSNRSLTILNTNQNGPMSQDTKQFYEETKLNTYKAYKFMEIIQKEYFMNPDTKMIHNEIFVKLKNSVNRFQNTTGSCYIATYVYGNYDAPEVVVLRKFRDDFLKSYLIGQWLISIYYLFSPIMIKSWGKSNLFYRISKLIIDALVRRLN